MCEDLFNDRPVLEASYPHLALALVLDISASMQTEENGIKRIDSLNKAINKIIDTINEDALLKNILDLGIFVFGEKDKEPVYQGFCAISNCEHITLQANDGETWVADALNTAVDRLRERTNLYAQGGGAFRPYLILITDGNFFDYPDDLDTIAEKVRQREREGKLDFFALGFEGSNRTQLENFTNNSERVIEVKGSNLVEFFKWLRCVLPYKITDRMEITPIEIPPLIFHT